MKISKITALALVGVLVFLTAGFSGCLGRIDDHAGDLLDVDGELIGAWEVSHGTDE